MKKLLLTLAAVSALAASARTEEIRLWRGETRAWVLNDATKIGDAPVGFSVRVGTALEVRYLERPRGTHYTSIADRVQWGSTAPGVKVAELSVAPDVKPGAYTLGDLRVTVIDRVLPPPSEWKFHLDLWQHPWAVARYFGLTPFSPEHYAALRPVLQTLATAGNKSLTVTLLDLPWNHQCYDGYRTMIRHIKRKDGSWAFDYRLFDEYVAFGRSCGLGKIIGCYTMCPWDYGVTWEDESGKIFKARAVPGTAEFNDYWGDFLSDFARHLKEKGWFEATHIGMDERSPEDVQNICKLIQEKAPGLKTSLAGDRAPSHFKGIRIDQACFGLGYLSEELLAEAATRRAQGMLTTFYVCCGPAHPNTMFPNELDEAFWIGAYPSMAGLDGFLRWAWNSWPQDPTVDGSYGNWNGGDTFLSYPDGSPSLRFLSLRNGIVCSEKVRLLKEKGLFLKELADLAKKFDRKAALANKADFRALRKMTMEAVNRD